MASPILITCILETSSYDKVLDWYFPIPIVCDNSGTKKKQKTCIQKRCINLLAGALLVPAFGFPQHEFQGATELQLINLHSASG